MNRLARREVYREFAISGVHTAELGLKRGNAGLRRRVSIEGIGDEWQDGRVAPFVYDSLIVNQGTEMAEYFAVMGLNSIRLVAVSKTDRMMNTQPFIELRNHIRHEVGSRVRNDVVVQTEGAK